MGKEFKTSVSLIKRLGYNNEYYSHDYIFWFDPDPSIVFVVKNNGKVLIKKVLNGETVSLEYLWKKLSSEQQKIATYHLDKFI